MRLHTSNLHTFFPSLVSKVQQRGDKPRGSIDSLKDWVGLHSSCIMVPVWFLSSPSLRPPHMDTPLPFLCSSPIPLLPLPSQCILSPSTHLTILFLSTHPPPSPLPPLPSPLPQAFDFLSDFTEEHSSPSDQDGEAMSLTAKRLVASQLAS